MEMSWTVADIALKWANDNAVWVVVVATLAILAARTTIGEDTMARRAREDFIGDAFCYQATDQIEDAIADGKLSRLDASYLYSCLRRGFPRLRTIIPNPERVKEKIENRLGKHIEPNLPDATAPKVMKHMFDVPGIKLPKERVVL